MSDEVRKSKASPEPAVLPQWALEAARPVVRLISRTLWRLRYEGVENIPADSGGLIIAANHQTYIDPFWVSLPIRRPVRYLAWSEAFKWPAMSRPLELLGAWPLDVEKGDPTAYKRSLQWLRAGGAMMIFPEGGRCGPDGSMLRFKTGAVRIALETGAPILPVTIRGGHRVWPRGWRMPHLGRIQLIYHPPRVPALLRGEDARDCARRETAALAEIIKSAL